MEQSKIQRLFSDSSSPTLRASLLAVAFLAWPAVVEQIMITLVQYINTAMVGSLGGGATAAVGIVSTTIWLFNGLFNAASVGFSVQVAQRIGAGDNVQAQKVCWQALKFGVIFGCAMGISAVLLSFPLPTMLGAGADFKEEASMYFRITGISMPFLLISLISSAILRCSGNTALPMLLNTLTNVLVVIFNYLLIYPSRQIRLISMELDMWGAGLGVSGAAFSTAIASAIVCVLFLLCIFLRESPVKLSLKVRYGFEKTCLSAAWVLGLPVALERTALCIAQIIITMLISGLGTAAVAANHLAVTAEAVSYLPAFGVAIAGTTLIGQAIGAGRKDLAVRFSRIVFYLGVAIMTLGGVLLYVFAPNLMGLFSDEYEIIDLGTRVLRIVAFAQPLFGAAIVSTGVLRGAGDSKWPFIISLVSMWGVRIVLALILTSSMGLVGVWIAMAAELCVRGTIFIIRLFSNRWLNINLFKET